MVAAIMYTKAQLVAEDGASARALTLGPVAVEPGLQRHGIGKRLIELSFERARELGFEAIVLFGDPANYVARGFVSCKRLGMSLEGGVHPAAMLAREIVSGALAGRSWTYADSPALHIDAAEAERYDEQFSPMEKGWSPQQESFYILSNATLD